MGDPVAIEGVLSSASSMGRQMYWETDLVRCVDRWSANFLVGPEQGYVGYSEGGTEFTRRIEEMTKTAANWAAGHRVHRPFPILVFRNLHRACPEVQQIVETLATRGILSLPSGKELTIPRRLVIATAPGAFPRDPSTAGCQHFVANAVDAKARRPLFDSALSTSFTPLAMPSPTIETIPQVLSVELGARWASTLPSGTLIHRRIVAGPNLTQAALSRADLVNSDRGWHRLWEKVTRAFPSMLEEYSNAPLPPSLVVPTRWRVVVELEGENLWTDFQPVEEIAQQEITALLPPGLAESLGADVPASKDWANPMAGAQINEQVVGQEGTVDDIVSKIEHFASALSRQRPLFSALLLGPTGTGKTMLSGKLAAAYDRPLVRIDCASLQDEGALQEAIFGYHAESLGTQVATNPSSLVLLDEVEKAHPSVWYMLMQALDEGLLRSPSGRPDISLRKCVVLATSNQLSDQLGDLGEYYRAKTHAEADSSIRTALRVGGFVNEAVMERLDAVYLMAPLSKAYSTLLWGKILRDDFGLTATPEVLSHLAAQHEDLGTSRGARAIRRACLEIQSRPREWGVQIEGTNLTLRTPFTPVSRRARFWASPSENLAGFQAAATHAWVGAALQELFALNASKTHPSTPQAIVLLSGPSSSGKSHLAMELSRIVGKGDAEVIDCSSGDEEILASQIFGAPGSPGRLSSTLLARPDRVVLFDNLTPRSPHFIQRLVKLLHAGGYRDGSTGEYVDTRHGAFFLVASLATETMQDLCGRVTLAMGPATPSCAPPPAIIYPTANPHASHARSEAIAAMEAASHALASGGFLSCQTLEMIDLIIPFGLPSDSAIWENSRRVVLATAKEFGFGPAEASLAEGMVDSSTMGSLSTLRVRQEASRIFSSMAKRHQPPEPHSPPLLASC